MILGLSCLNIGDPFYFELLPISALIWLVLSAVSGFLVGTAIFFVQTRIGHRLSILSRGVLGIGTHAMWLGLLYLIVIRGGIVSDGWKDWIAMILILWIGGMAGIRAKEPVDQSA